MTSPKKFTHAEILRQLEVWEGMGPLSIQGRISKQLLAEVEAWRAAAEVWEAWYMSNGTTTGAWTSVMKSMKAARELDPEPAKKGES